MNLIEIYYDLRADLEIVEKRLLKEVQSNEKVLQKASAHLLKAGGKRIRPVFVLLAAKFGEYDLERLSRVAVALELIHMATLVHDDVIDDADKRRGSPTVKSAWGNRIAMYTGDFILARALQILADVPDLRSHQILADSIVQMCEGEIEQVRDFYRFDQHLRTYLRRIKRKTALLLSVSCTLGALAANCKETVVQALGKYAYNLGMAFQITDDILDMTATEKKLGKPVGSDLRQGNITLPVLYACRVPETANTLRRLIHRDMTDQEVASAISRIRSVGAIEQSQALADRYLARALKHLDALPNLEWKEKLRQIAIFISKREY
ncbi:polyprenyl synthetase family protein [Fodinisporobacter ferrooxydans]|uniref:Polyprenyl synthetase family protein n=1 Tax=Fodinisporobacter ferrooxydans TaxID=2901836 RepID=A0ABY4CPF4_9BACL|nr:polyprenyl synthetase family protein [Alicyclobacillaceae bacterium MYW30-H2]